MAFFNPMLDIGLIAFALAIVSQLLQRRFLDKKLMKEQQEQIKQKQQKIKELASKKDDKFKSEIEKLETEMLGITNVMMKGSLRHMMFSMAVFLPAFWFIGATYDGAVIYTPIPLPLIHRDFSFEITARMSWLWYYIYVGIVCNILLNAIMNLMEKNNFVRTKILKK